MKQSSITAYLMAGVALTLSFFVYMNYVYLLGFPDGFVTELGFAQRRLAYFFIGTSALFSAGFICLGTVAMRKQIRKTVFSAVILYLVIVVSVMVLDYYYRLNMTGSSGG